MHNPNKSFQPLPQLGFSLEPGHVNPPLEVGPRPQHAILAGADIPSGCLHGPRPRPRFPMDGPGDVVFLRVGGELFATSRPLLLEHDSAEGPRGSPAL